MRSAGDGDATTPIPVPWGSGTVERVARPRWLDSRPMPVSAMPFDGHGIGDSVAPPSHDEPEVGAQASALEATLAAAMAAASAEPTGIAPAPLPTRDYDGELAALEGVIGQLEAQLAAMAEAPHRIRKELLEASEPEVVELAVALAERIVGRELATDPALVARWAAEALGALADQGDLVVLVSEDVFATIPRDAWRDGKGRPYTPTVDPRLGPGSCDVRSALSRIDASVTARVRAVVEALGATEERTSP